MATFPHFLIDFRQISREAHNFYEEIQGQGIVFENFTPRRVSLWGIDSGKSDFSDFQWLPPVWSRSSISPAVLRSS